MEGSINELALHDFRIFKEAYDVDWDDIEKELGVHFISMIRVFHSPDNLGIIYSQSLRERIDELNGQLAAAEDVHQMYDVLTGFYKDYGVGKFGLHRLLKLSVTGRNRRLPRLHGRRKWFFLILSVMRFKRKN